MGFVLYKLFFIVKRQLESLITSSILHNRLFNKDLPCHRINLNVYAEHLDQMEFLYEILVIACEEQLQ